MNEEKLIDDVLGFICEFGIAVVKFQEDVEPEEFARFNAYVGFGREHAKQLIARIGKAYADGMELPDEAGRAAWLKQGDEDHIYDWVADVIESGARTFIALSPEENK